MTKLFDMTDMKFERLTVLSRAETSKAGQTRWNCRCDCGSELVVQAAALKCGHTRSCGCLKIEQTIAMSTKHGHATKGISRTYRTWAAMISRCSDQNANGFRHYGGRGISVCQEWREFSNFVRDMGEKPHGMSLDRIDVNGNYEPGNCRWATLNQQARNRRDSRCLTYRGETKSVHDWAEENGLPVRALVHRLNAGWSTEDALSKPSDGAANKPNLRFIEHNGECLSISEWSRRSGVKLTTLFYRLNAGWPMERILSEGVSSRL